MGCFAARTHLHNIFPHLVTLISSWQRTPTPWLWPWSEESLKGVAGSSLAISALAVSLQDQRCSISGMWICKDHSSSEKLMGFSSGFRRASLSLPDRLDNEFLQLPAQPQGSEAASSSTWGLWEVVGSLNLKSGCLPFPCDGALPPCLLSAAVSSPLQHLWLEISLGPAHSSFHRSISHWSKRVLWPASGFAGCL